MKTLYLLRHAKSSWETPGIDDFDRPLNGRGREAAARMAGHLDIQGWRPELILCSAARRTRETLDFVLAGLAARPTVAIEPGLYLADRVTLLKRLHQVEADIASVMMIGHNPGMERLAAELCSAGDPDDLSALKRKYPTCGLAVIALSGRDWAHVKPGAGRLAVFVTPRGLEKIVT